MRKYSAEPSLSRVVPSNTPQQLLVVYMHMMLSLLSVPFPHPQAHSSATLSRALLLARDKPRALGLYVDGNSFVAFTRTFFS